MSFYSLESRTAHPWDEAKNTLEGSHPMGVPIFVNSMDPWGPATMGWQDVIHPSMGLTRIQSNITVESGHPMDYIKHGMVKIDTGNKPKTPIVLLYIHSTITNEFTGINEKCMIIMEPKFYCGGSVKCFPSSRCSSSSSSNNGVHKALKRILCTAITDDMGKEHCYTYDGKSYIVRDIELPQYKFEQIFKDFERRQERAKTDDSTAENIYIISIPEAFRINILDKKQETVMKKHILKT